MSDHAELQADVYSSDPETYDRLVSAEDVDGNLARSILGPLAGTGSRVVEVGAGTGRITRLLEVGGAVVVASDRERAMLGQARVRGSTRLAVADAVALPHPDRCADMAVAGWVFAHFRLWMPDGWEAAAGAAISEMRRTLRPGGRLVVVESLGTGVSEATAPSEELEEFHDWLSTDHGLVLDVISTDYEFASIEEAAVVTGRFFGEEFADRVRAHEWRRIPEFTGVWAST